MPDTRQVIIIGSGPAGLTAALYTARANLRPLVIAGYEAGGQLMITTGVENYPGFPDGIQGPELMQRMRQQAERFGAEYIDSDATAVDFSGQPLRVEANGVWHETRTVIIATGASARWLDLESEQRLIGRGVSSCATCDGFFFKDGKIFVVGGGDTAMEEALFLAGLADSVTVIHRRDELRASRVMQERALKHPKIQFAWNTVVNDVLGEEKVAGVQLQNVETGELSQQDCDALFVAIGHIPNTDIFKGQIELTDTGYVKLYPGMRTSVDGVFVAGDAQDFRYRQAVTAAADGCKAALEVERWLAENETPAKDSLASAAQD